MWTNGGNGTTIYGLICALIALSSSSTRARARNGLARGIYNRMNADGRYAGRRLITELPFCVNGMLPTNGSSAYQMVFGGNPADNFGWGGEDGDLLYVQDTSLPGQFGAQWKLRAMAREAATNCEQQVASDSCVQQFIWRRGCSRGG